MRRTIIADEQGRYRFRSILPNGYGVPPGSPTAKLLTALGRHGQRPAHIHFFIGADDHRKLTNQNNNDANPLPNDDVASPHPQALVPKTTQPNTRAKPNN